MPSTGTASSNSNARTSVNKIALSLYIARYQCSVRESTVRQHKYLYLYTIQYLAPFTKTAHARMKVPFSECTSVAMPAASTSNHHETFCQAAPGYSLALRVCADMPRDTGADGTWSSCNMPQIASATPHGSSCTTRCPAPAMRTMLRSPPSHASTVHACSSGGLSWKGQSCSEGDGRRGETYRMSITEPKIACVDTARHRSGSTSSAANASS